MIIGINIMKLCSRCQILKPPSKFRVDKKSKDGRRNICIKCLKEVRERPRRSRKHESQFERTNKKVLNKNLCNILKYHKNVMDEDDERLHTQFMLDVIKHKI